MDSAVESNNNVKAKCEVYEKNIFHVKGFKKFILFILFRTMCVYSDFSTIFLSLEEN